MNSNLITEDIKNKLLISFYKLDISLMKEDFKHKCELMKLKNKKNKQLLKNNQRMIDNISKTNKKSFMEIDKEKNYKNKILIDLLRNSYNNLDDLCRPKNDNCTLFLQRLYVWLIDEDFTLDIISECNYSSIERDLRENKLHDPLYGRLFWNNFKRYVTDYLKYGTTDIIEDYLNEFPSEEKINPNNINNCAALEQYYLNEFEEGGDWL